MVKAYGWYSWYSKILELRNIYKDINGEQKVVVYNPHGYEVEMTYAEFMARVNDVAYINEYVQK